MWHFIVSAQLCADPTSVQFWCVADLRLMSTRRWSEVIYVSMHRQNPPRCLFQRCCSPWSTTAICCLRLDAANTTQSKVVSETLRASELPLQPSDRTFGCFFLQQFWHW